MGMYDKRKAVQVPPGPSLQANWHATANAKCHSYNTAAELQAAYTAALAAQAAHKVAIATATAAGDTAAVLAAVNAGTQDDFYIDCLQRRLDIAAKQAGNVNPGGGKPSA